MDYSKKEIQKIADTKLLTAQQAEKTNAFNAAILYKQALDLFKRLNDKEKISLCLSKTRELNREAQKEFKQSTVTQEISQDDIDRVINPFREIKNFEDGLYLFARHPAFILDYDKAKSHIEDGPFIAHKICSNLVVNGKGDVIKGGEDGNKSMLMQSYFIHEEITNQIYLAKAWEVLLEKRLQPEDVLNFFKNRLGFHKKTLKLLENGIGHVFTEDPIAAIHVLVPRFEEMMFIIAQGLGLQMVALERSKEVATRNKMIGLDFVKDEEIQEKFGKNFCEHAAFLLFDPLGLNLRNHVAHGDIQIRHLTFQQSLGVLRLLLYFPSRFSGNHTS